MERKGKAYPSESHSRSEKERVPKERKTVES